METELPLDLEVVATPGMAGSLDCWPHPAFEVGDSAGQRSSCGASGCTLPPATSCPPRRCLLGGYWSHSQEGADLRFEHPGSLSSPEGSACDFDEGLYWFEAQLLSELLFFLFLFFP